MNKVKALNIKVLFRKNADKKTSTVYFKIFVNGTKTREFSTGLNGNEQDFQILEEVERLKSEIRDLYAYLKQQNPHVSAKILRDEWRKPKLESQVMQVINNYINYKHPKVERSTYKTYFTYRKNFVNFLKNRKLDKITIQEMNVKIGREYLNYLDTHTSFSNIHKSKCIAFLKSVLRYAQREELIGYTSFLELERPKHTPRIATYLEDDELLYLQKYSIANPTLSRVRDLFVFQAFTGFAYIEMCNFDIKKDTFQDSDGTKWIKKSRQKTGTLILLPFFDDARQILKKYEGKLPLLSNQKYNKYLKEVAEITGINKHITTHVARHTAGMFWLNAGISLEVVSRMLGHKNTLITQTIYARILKRRIKSEVNQFLINTKKPLNSELSGSFSTI